MVYTTIFLPLFLGLSLTGSNLFHERVSMETYISCDNKYGAI